MSVLKKLIQDFSVSAVVAALIVVMVGMTSSAIIVFQAANSFGANPAQAGSWLGSLCVGLGLLSIYFSVKYKAPILMAWSTPGAVVLMASASAFTLAEATSAFIFSAVLIVVCGVTGFFEKVMNRIPLGLAAGLLAGILINFSVAAFSAFSAQPLMLGLMILVFVVGKKYFPNLNMLFVLVVGVAVAAISKQLHFESVNFIATKFTFVKPEFSWAALFGLGLPLFVVTMASQNVTGITIMRSYGYHNPISRIVTKMGLMNLVTAFFGGFTINFAAITAAIAMSPEAHPDARKRYVAAVVAGVIYIIIGVMAGTVTSLFAAFPKELVVAIAGLALVGAVTSSLQKAMSVEKEKESALMTFIIAASSFKFLGLGSPFWALVIGLLVQLVASQKKVSA
jgi:benzoate membrane transport protein